MPTPTGRKRAAATPYFVVSSRNTANARRSDNAMFASKPPTLSVCPTHEELEIRILFQQLRDLLQCLIRPSVSDTSFLLAFRYIKMNDSVPCGVARTPNPGIVR
jgi:hypothetical protein